MAIILIAPAALLPTEGKTFLHQDEAWSSAGPPLPAGSSSLLLMNPDWNTQLLDQLDQHWKHQARPRLDGLGDDEYFWEPAPGCWSVRPRGYRTAAALGSGDYVLELAYPAPDPEPVTTIAWRLAHIVVGCFGVRNAAHFGAPPADWETFAYSATAAQALCQLDEAYAQWNKGVRDLGAAGLTRPCGPAEGPFAEYPMASLVLHINREVIHHLAEIALLRDLYRADRQVAGHGT